VRAAASASAPRAIFASLARAIFWPSGTARGADVDAASLRYLPSLALTWRRRAPLAVLAITAGLFFFLVMALVPPSGDGAITVAVAVLIALYSVGAHTGGRQAVAGVVATLVLVLGAIVADPEETDLNGYLFFS
jgi:hypothetical protein